MKYCLLLFMFIIVACASNRVRMSDVETAVFLKSNPDLINAISANTDPGIRYTHSYTISDDTGNWKIDCYGSTVKYTQCWKEPLVLSSRSQIEEVIPKIKDPQQLKQRLSKCSNVSELGSLRRKACIDYFSNIKTGGTQSSAEIVVKNFCDLQGVYCKKNGTKFGDGEFGITDTHGLSTRVQKKVVNGLIRSALSNNRKEQIEYTAIY